MPTPTAQKSKILYKTKTREPKTRNPLNPICYLNLPSHATKHSHGGARNDSGGKAQISTDSGKI